MMRLVLAAILAFGGSLAQAQSASNAPAGTVRVLDKITGKVEDVTLAVADSRDMGLLQIRLDECRYPTNNPSGDAFAHLTLSYRGDSAPIFSGWMVASVPALNPLDHARFDVWVLRCSTS